MNKQLQKRIKNIELQKKAIELRNENKNNYTRKELNLIAKAVGIFQYYKLTKHDLAEKLGIQLARKRLPRFRIVEIINSDETITTYSSMNQAAQAIGTNPMMIYVMAAKGNARFVNGDY